MAIQDAFFTSVSKDNPTNSFTDKEVEQKPVSEFLTVQSFTNFAAMTGAITAAWSALQALDPVFEERWTPFTLAILFFLVSFISSLVKNKGAKTWDLGTFLSAFFIGAVNSLVLFGAVIGVVDVGS